MKKLFMISIGLLIILIIILSISKMYFESKVENEKLAVMGSSEEIPVDESASLFNSEEERQAYIKSFESKGIYAEDGNTENSGGHIQSSAIIGIDQVYEYFPIEAAAAFENMLTEGIDSLNNITQIGQMSDEVKKTYFKQNQKQIFVLFGIDNEADFILFSNKVSQVMLEDGLEFRLVDFVFSGNYFEFTMVHEGDRVFSCYANFVESNNSFLPMIYWE